MKRILYSCFVFLCLTQVMRAQVPFFSIPQNPQCYSSTNSYTSQPEIGLNVPTATNYIWTAFADNCTPTLIPVGGTSVSPWGNITNTAVTVSLSCCGNYTVICIAQLIGGAATPVNQNAFTSGNFTYGVIYCPSGGASISTSTTICAGNSATIIGTPGQTSYTWNTGATTSSIIVNPAVNTCYNYTATSPAGCTITPTAASCVSVQAITSTFSPVSQTMCAGSPICFTATGVPQTGASYAPGTTITGYQWFDPFLNSIGTTSTVCVNAPAGSGVYGSIITHTGAAGTCTVSGISNFVLGTSIPVTVTPASASVCPGGAITLTAVTLNTITATNYTWITSNGVTTNTSPVHNNPHSITVTNPPWTVTVNVNYYNCPGTATTTIGLLTLTPTLTSSAPQSCPGQSLSLTADGGINYTFTALRNNFPGTTVTIPNAPSTNSVVVHTPVAGNFPIQYCVSAYSAGCTGTTCIVVTQKVLTPTLSASSVSVCPLTEFTLTAGGSGVAAGSTFTYYSTAPTGQIGTANPLIYTPTLAAMPRTYSVVVDSAGCRGTATISISKLTLTPTLTAGSPSICAGTPVDIMSTGGAGTNYTFMASVAAFTAASSTATTIAGTNATVTHVPPSTATLITYSVSVDSAGCIGSDTYTIGILDLATNLNLSTSPLSGSVCPGTTFTINATGALTYTFFAPGTGSFATASAPAGSITVSGSTLSPSPIPFPAGAVYTVQADSSSCIGTKTIALHEFKLHPTIVLSPSLVCAGQPVTVTASGVGSYTSATTYTFGTLAPTIGSLSPAGTASYIVVSPTVQTVYSVLVDSMGCTGVIPPPQATINIRPGLTILPSTSAASVCPGLIATLCAVAPTTALSYTYTWSQITGTGQITPSNTTCLGVYPTSNSTYSVHVVDSLGCVGDTLISVGIDPSISFSISLASSGSTICVPQSVVLSASSTVALNNNSIGTINYSWTPSTALSATLSPTVTASPTVTTIYTVTADNGYGCVAQNTIDVAVGTIPVPQVAATANSVCVGFTSTLTAFGGITYTWTGTTFTNSIAQQSISVPSGNYTVIASNGGGCTNVATFAVGSMTPLTINVTQSSYTTCIASNFPKYSNPVHLTASGAGSYVWFPYNPLYMTYSLGPQTDVRPPATTQYTVIGSTAICSGTGVVSVVVIPQFTVNVVPPLPAMCYGDSIKLSVVNIGSLAVGPAFSYSWTEALNAPPLSISDYFSSTVTVYPQNTTTYTTQVADTRSCVSFPRLVTVTVLPRPETAVSIPTINNVPTNTVCFVGLSPGAQDVTINLTANNTNTGLQFGVVPTYTWLSPYVPTSILSPPNSNVVTVSAPVRLLNGSAVAVYTVISGYNGVAGCKRVDTVSIRAIDCRPIYNVRFTTAEPVDTICTKSCITFVTLTDTMAGGPQQYKWEFKGGSPATSTLSNPTVCYNFPTAFDNFKNGYPVILQVSNPYPLINPNGGPTGSAASFGKNTVVVVDIPNVTIVAPGQVRSDTTVRFGASVNLKGSGAHTYEWSPAYNITSLTKPNVTVNPFQTTQYILTGYNSKGCASSDTINVIVIEDCGEMYVPNAFTPNNDGANDVLYVRGICLQSLTFMVFNRWGEKVFETADQSIGWDGTYKGEALNTGVFVYRLEGKTYDGKAFSSKGNITLIR